MLDKSNTQDDSATGLTRVVPWTVTSVRPLPGHRLAVQFADGTSGYVDVSKLIFGPAPGVFRELRDPARFEQVGVEHGAVTWLGGPDLAPDAMYDALRANGSWTLS